MKFSLLLAILCLSIFNVNAQSSNIIRISTDKTDLVFHVPNNGRLYQAYFGSKLLHDSDIQNHVPSNGVGYARGWEAYMTSGMEDYFEPALGITHNDGNMSTLLKFVSSDVVKINDDASRTIITLKDEVYPVEVKLFYEAYIKENVIKSWTEISHSEKKPVTMFRYASSMLFFEEPHYYLTQFNGDWAREVKMTTQELTFGKKVLDTKLGSRAAMFVSPFFQLSLGQPATETEGRVLVGTINWTGNFQFTFEVDQKDNLRVISGINPYASEYVLKPKEIFKTPEFVFTLSDEGTGYATRSLHDWARRYHLKDGMGGRMSLLNNWESTGFNFNEEKLEALMQEAKDLGVDMFLLDDGWFANKYPRSSATTGLGDWDVTKDKLPNGVEHLVKKADEIGVKFGIWIEPEMVSPKSELFEKHPDWVIHLPNRQTYYFRSQLVLDLSNPKVQDYVYDVVDKIMTDNPGVAYFKWDCNSPITNIYSPYLKDKQSQLYVDYVRGLYNVLDRLQKKYPNLPMMLCSGGGGRCDFEALKYFTEFWPSDNTDAIERIFIQWGFSQVFPIKSMCAHVTSWGKQSIKFRTDVAMMCKLGFDIRIAGMSDNDKVFCRAAVKNFQRLSPVILDGDMFRLVSPYETAHAAVMYASKDKNKAVLYAYDIHPRYDSKLLPVKLQGLDPAKNYKVEEINLMPGQTSNLRDNGKVFSGDYLMKAGLRIFRTAHLNSRIIEITAQ